MNRIAFACASLLALSATPALADEAQEEANKKVVLEFYDAGLNQKDFAKAAQYLGPRYIQHNPNAADGPEGFHRFIDFLREKYPQSQSEIKQAFADGDFVILHVHAVREPGTRGLAIVDIFRLDNGKVVEHWDVVQPIPEQSANGNGMF
jgi:predicted SnoaL-like aldol condensation-catalyzing enzyme